MDYSLIPCKREHLAQLRELSISTFVETYEKLNDANNFSSYIQSAFHIDQLQREMEDPNSHFFLLYYQSKAAGYIKLNEDSAQTEFKKMSSMEIERIYVSHDFQGLGFGKVLIQKCIKVARSRGKKSIWLGVWQKNPKAIEFYQHMGFNVGGTHTFQLGDEAQKDYIMEYEL